MPAARHPQRVTCARWRNLAVVDEDAARAERLPGRLLAGVDLLVPRPTETGGAATLVWSVWERLGQVFKRAVALVCLAPSVPAWTVATAVSALAGTDLLLGPTNAAHPYLVGVRDERGVGLLGAADDCPPAVATLSALARSAGLVIRGVEARPCLDELPDPATLRTALGAVPGLAPRTTAWLDELSSPRPQIADGALAGEGRDVALGDTPAQCFMGLWSEGVPVAEARVTNEPGAP